MFLQKLTLALTPKRDKSKQAHKASQSQEKEKKHTLWPVAEIRAAIVKKKAYKFYLPLWGTDEAEPQRNGLVWYPRKDLAQTKVVADFEAKVAKWFRKERLNAVQDYVIYINSETALIGFYVNDLRFFSQVVIVNRRTPNSWNDVRLDWKSIRAHAKEDDEYRVELNREMWRITVERSEEGGERVDALKLAKPGTSKVHFDQALMKATLVPTATASVTNPTITFDLKRIPAHSNLSTDYSLILPNLDLAPLFKRSLAYAPALARTPKSPRCAVRFMPFRAFAIAALTKWDQHFLASSELFLQQLDDFRVAVTTGQGFAKSMLKVHNEHHKAQLKLTPKLAQIEEKLRKAALRLNEPVDVDGEYQREANLHRELVTHYGCCRPFYIALLAILLEAAEQGKWPLDRAHFCALRDVTVTAFGYVQQPSAC